MKKLFILAALVATFTACNVSTPTETNLEFSDSLSVVIDSAHIEETLIDTVK